ncbi:hypothetical protein GLOTRDRAFT_137395 [Gloeophyllum trabeum ATCC 11539]|uniref:Uncharacterized protein n=1 Tax=Gloeophyllum trabeum (strain ATCC 11539 / FP-39264 / Madison 617) TaxID=670483 RepID=S7RUN4_GLOTA|nr:uncharacterized protein GLOTRDRAFT_137395 [Gloeophyllum trabeum ATCC 11539]EPQ56914.1 hypothetical protein GLOTRDRAFT_137395 [Gloeophyllum trabeum ATCC 11539]
MSSTADPGWWKRPRTIVLPVLPPELWIEIFEFATYVPGAVQSQSYNPFETIVPLPQLEELRSLKIAYRTKRSLVLVCKRWRELATPILYRIVLADHTKGVERLHRTLVSDFQSSSVVGSLRACVRRLVCVTLSSGVPFDLLAEIIRSIPTLVIFNLWPAKYRGINLVIPENIRLSLATQGESLRVLDWAPGYVDAAALHEWRQMVSSLPGLRILRYWHGMALPPGTSFTPVRLPNLIYSSWDSIGLSRGRNSGRLTAEDDLRALQSLEFRDHLPPVPPHIGHNITLLSVPVSPCGIRGQIPELLAMLPNLVHLVLRADDWPIIPQALPLPRIQKLGLGRFTGQACKNRDYTVLFDNLFSIDAPQLRVVRFVGWDEWSALSHRGPRVLARFRELAPSRPFRVEDREGRLLTDLWGLN